MRTPWGDADTVEYIGTQGIKRINTPSHGGYYVPRKLLGRIPEAHQLYALKWSGSRQWYEEDCAWPAVVLAFPELFTAEHVAEARESAAHYLNREN